MWKSYFEWYLKQYFPQILKNKNWNYTNDLCLLGANQLFLCTHRQFYRDALLRAAPYLIDENGCMKGWKEQDHNLDQISRGKTLFLLWENTGEPRYRKAIEQVWQALQKHPRTECGNFWHKDIYPNQVWLDGLYMALPFYAAYESRFGEKAYGDILKQFQNVRRLLWSQQKRLYYHAWDESRMSQWVNSGTGCSPCFWLRAEGWFLMALADCCEFIGVGTPPAKILCSLLQEAVDGLLPYRDKKSGMFLQLIDRADLPANYPETSGSAMVTYSMLKGIRLKMLPESYAETALDVWNGIEKTCLVREQRQVHLTHICASAGLGPGPDHRTDRTGSAEYYLSERQQADNEHGAGAAMLAYAEVLRFNCRGSAFPCTR